MSGHSKWATTKHKKMAIDAKKGKAFSKLAKNISVAARAGADPDLNFSLRLAIDKAKEVNMPKDNIERAIARGSGTGEGGALETAVYEGMGPGGVAFLVEVVTDNTNRTYTEIKTLFNKHGANMEAKVMWQFAHKGVVRVENIGALTDREAFELALIDAGAEDIRWQEDEGLVVICEIPHLQRVSEAVQAARLEVSSAGLEYVPTNTREVADDQAEKLADFIGILEENDDVDSVYTNAA